MNWVWRVLVSVIVLIGAWMIGLQWFQDKMIFFPARGVPEDPSKYQTPFEERWIQTADGEKLHAWYSPATHPTQKTLIHFHGNAGNIGGRAWLQAFLHELDINVLLFDYRGYGNSTGRPSEGGLYRDAEAVYRDFTEKRGVAPQDLILYGSSLGGSVAMDLAARFPVGKLIVESTFTSTLDMAKVLYPALPVRSFMRNQFNVMPKLANLKMPKLVIHGKRDEIVPFFMGEKIFQGMPEPKSMYVVEKAGHNDTLAVDEREYFRRLRLLDS